MAPGASQLPLLGRGVVAMGGREHRGERPSASPSGMRRRRWQGTPRQGQDRGRRFRNMARFMEQAQLMGGGRPDGGEQGGREGGAVGDHLLGTDTGVFEPPQKDSNSGTIHGAGDQLLPNEAIPRGGGWIDGQQQGQLALIHFIDTKDPTELLSYQG